MSLNDQSKNEASFEVKGYMLNIKIHIDIVVYLIDLYETNREK